MAILLTELAANQVKSIIAENKLPTETKLRIGVRGGGCSGMNYSLDLTEDPAGESDETIEAHGVQIVIDSKSLIYLDGTEIDYKQDTMQSGFTFRNPNATSTCGCGSSFSA